MAGRDIDIKIGARDTASTVMSAVSRNVKKLGADVAKMGRQAAQSMKAFGQSLTGLGTKFAAMGAAGVAAFGLMARTFATFDDNMAKVSAITGATGADLTLLRDKAKELGSTTRFSAAEAAEGMRFLGMAGFDTQQIIAGIGPTLSLAAAGGVELGEAADIASDVGSAFGLTADELGRVADVIAAAATSANTDVLMMGETFKKLAPIAKAAGQSIEETSAAAGILGNSGVKASEAGTDLKNILANMSTPAVQKKLEALGVTIKDSTGEFLPLLDIMTDFNTKTASMTGPEKLAKSVELFGKRSAKSALILGSAGNSVDVLRKKMNNAEGAADRMAKTMETGLGGTMTKIKSAFEGFQIAVIEQIAVPLKQAGAFVAEFIGKLTKWIAENQKLVQALAIGTVAITALGGAMVAAGVTITGLGVLLAGLVAGLTTLGSVAAAAFTPMGLVIGGVTIALGTLAAMLVKATVESGALGVAFGMAKRTLLSMKETVQKTFKGITEALRGGDWKLAMEVAVAGLNSVFWKGLQGMFDATQIVLPKIFAAFKDLFVDLIKAAGRTGSLVFNALLNPNFDVADALKIAFVGIGEGFGEGASAAIAAEVRSAETRLDALVAKAQAVGDKARAGDAFGEIGSKIGTTIGDVVKNGVDVKGLVGSALDAASSLPDKLASLMPDDWMKVEKQTAALTDGATNAAGEYVKGVQLGIDAWKKGGAVDQIKGFFGNDLVKHFAGKFAPGLLQVGKEVVDAVTSPVVKAETKPETQLAELQANQGRLLTRGRGSLEDKVLDENRKQNKQLATIAKNTEKRPEPKGDTTELVVVS